MRDKSGERKYRYVVEDVDRHGNIRVYFRKPGQPKIRLHERPGTKAFDQEYQRAFQGEIAVPEKKAKRVMLTPTGTISWLIQQYYGSAQFKALSPLTKKARQVTLDRIAQRFGTFQFATMEPRDVARLRDERASTPMAANEIVKALRTMFNWARSPEYGYASKNPAEGIQYLKSKNPGGFKAWTQEDAAKYEARHPVGTMARLAFDLLIYTGVRRGDLIRLGPQMEHDGMLCFTELKGRDKQVKHHELPILPPLRRSIDATRTAI